MKKNQGITLIALIITIIVMLVLVAVSVSILVESDLIGAAEKAGDRFKAEQEKEQTLGQITIGNKTYASINDYINKNPITEEEEPEEPETPTEKLATPTISITDTTLTITAVENATSYDIYVGNTKKTSITTTTLDLSTISLEAGTHSITVKAVAEGYTESDASTAASYVLISFTVDESNNGGGTASYLAVEGMTWEKWIDSGYNTGAYDNAGSFTDWVHLANGYYVYTDAAVMLTSEIIADTAYSTNYVEHAGGSNN